MMLVHSLWDAEDIYGAIAVYKAIKPKDTANDKVFLVMGPWSHGGGIGDGSKLGADQLQQRHRAALPPRSSGAPFLDRYLKDGSAGRRRGRRLGAPAFETGTNKWRSLASWPSGCASGCAIKPAALRFGAGQKLSLGGAASDKGFDEYVADPAKPVPYRARPMNYGYDEAKGQSWPRWLADDQREASGRTDVLRSPRTCSPRR